MTVGFFAGGATSAGSSSSISDRLRFTPVKLPVPGMPSRLTDLGGVSSAMVCEPSRLAASKLASRAYSH